MASTSAEFAKNVLFSMSGRGIVLVAGLLYTYLIANALGPEDYGLVTFFINFIVGLLAIFGIKIFSDVAAVFSAKHKSRSFLLTLLKWQILISILVLAVVLVFSEKIIALLGKGNFSLLLVTAPLLILQPFYETFLSVLKAFKRFGKVFYALALENAVNLLAAAVLVISLGFGLMGVLYAKILSFVLVILLMAWFLCHLDWKQVAVSRQEVVRYLRGIVPENWLLAFRDQPLVWIQGFFLPAHILGLYFIAEKMFSYAIGNLSAAISEVLLPYNVEKHQDQAALARYTSLTIKFLIILSVLAGVALFLLGPIVLEHLFPAFREAYTLFAFFWISFAVRNLAPLGIVYKSLNKTTRLARGTLISILLALPAAVLLTWQWGVVGFILAESIASLAKNLYLLLHLRSLGIFIEIIPRPADIAYFWHQTLAAVERLRQRIT